MHKTNPAIRLFASGFNAWTVTGSRFSRPFYRQDPQPPASPPVVPPPAAPPAPEVITFTPEKLEEFKRQMRTEGAQQGLDERFKNWLKPEDARALKAELDALKKAREDKAKAEQTDLDKAREATNVALAEADKARREADQRIAQIQASVDARDRRAAILTAVDTLKAKGVMSPTVLADDVAKLTAEMFSVAEGKVTGKDQYERPCSVEEALTMWVAQPTRANYRPPAPAGTGTEPGRSPGAPQIEQAKTPEEAMKRVFNRGTHSSGKRTAREAAKPATGTPDGGMPTR